MPFGIAGGLGEAAAAILLLMLCIAAVYMLRAISAALARIPLPVVGGWISGAFDAIAVPAIDWLVGATNELWADAAWWMHGVSYIVDGLANDIVSGFDTAANALDHTITVTIPAWADHALGDAKTAIGESAGTIARDISGAATDIERVASADAARALAGAKTFASSIERDLTRIVAHDLTLGERYADHAIDDVKTWVGDQIGAIHIPDIGSLAETVAGLTATVAAVGVSVAALSARFEECAVTTCEGPNNLQGLLSNLLSLTGLAGLAVFLEQAIDNPAGVEQGYADFIQSKVVPLVTGGGDIVDAIEQAIGI